VDTSVIDFPALLLAIVVAALISAALITGYRGESKRRVWIVAGILSAVLLTLSAADVLRQSPRETHILAPILGATLPVLGALGMVLATRAVQMWLRALLVFATALVLLFGGLLLGAAVIPRWFAL
jgi:hypothetical protein